MKKLLIAILILFLAPFVSADWIYNPFTGNFDYYEPVSGADLGDLDDVIFTLSANGNLIYYNGTNWVNLATGTNGQVLTLAAGIPVWAAAPAPLAHATSHGVGGTDLVGHDNLTGFLATEHFLQTAITTVGTIGTGVWQGTILTPQYGGTGQNSSAWTGVPSVAAGVWGINAQLPESLGGTGQGVYVIGDLLYASAVNALSRLADVAVGQYLASRGVGVAPTWATLNQAAVAGLTTGSSPVFVTTKLSGLTDGYIPYHVNDATGLANSVIYTDGTNIGIGVVPSEKFQVAGDIRIIYSGNDPTLLLGDATTAGTYGQIWWDSDVDILKLGTHTGGIDTVSITEGGRVGIGLVPTANMDGFSIELGLLTLKERATPTADADYGKIYPKADGNLYFQDSAVGAEHAIGADYAGVSVHLNAVATDIALVEAWEKFLFFDTNSPEYISDGDHTSNEITIGSTGVYSIEFSADGNAAGVNKSYEFSVFELSSTATTITAATAADPVVITAAGHGFTGGERVAIKAMTAGGMVEVNDRIFTVADVVGATFELTDNGGASPANDIDGTGFAAYTTGGTVQLATELQVFSHRKFAVNGDTGSFSGGNHCSLTATNTIEFYIKGEDDNTNFTIDCLAMRIVRIN